MSAAARTVSLPPFWAAAPAPVIAAPAPAPLPVVPGLEDPLPQAATAVVRTIAARASAYRSGCSMAARMAARR